MCLADRVLVYGDCAVNPNPNAEQLADIAVSAAETALTFGIEPRVAMCSYSTGASGQGQDVDKVREATDIAREKGLVDETLAVGFMRGVVGVPAGNPGNLRSLTEEAHDAIDLGQADDGVTRVVGHFCCTVDGYEVMLTSAHQVDVRHFDHLACAKFVIDQRESGEGSVVEP